MKEQIEKSRNEKELDTVTAIQHDNSYSQSSRQRFFCYHCDTF
jgi:hypothetical protein